jgi:hypothetical protein
MTRIAVLIALALSALPLGAAYAQAQPAAASPPPASPAAPAREELEPAVNTSAAAAADPAETAPAAGAATHASTEAAPTPAAGNSAPPAAPAQSATASAQAARTAAAAHTPANAHPAASGKAMDHLELDTTDITGNRELPKVLYIVPWKRSDLGDVIGKPVNSLLDEALEPVDRDVFKRENRYYRALATGDHGAPAAQPGAAQNPAGPAK